MRLLLVLLAATLVACQCPPEGGTALLPGQDLFNLPAFGTYYICASSAVVSEQFDPTLEWNVTSGVFRLRDSQLFVDDLVQINIIAPARVQFINSFIDSIDRDQNDDTNWRGIRVFGQNLGLDIDPSIPFQPNETMSRRSVDSPQPLSAPPASGRRARTPSYYGDCGEWINVGIDNVSDDDDGSVLSALGFFDCDGKTTVKSIRFFRGHHLLKFVNCTGMILSDIIATHRPDDSALAGIISSNSQLAFIRPFMNHEDDDFEARDGSHITLCYPFFEEGDRTVDSKLVLGESSTVAIAGPNNIYADLPGHLEFEEMGGVIYYLKTCPKHFASGYDAKLWTNFVTGVDNDRR